MSDSSTKHRFATYLTDAEHREVEMMRAELGLPNRKPNAIQDRQILTIMRMATRVLMDEIRQQKTQAMENGGVMALAEWQDVCERAGVPQAFFERILDEDPRPLRVRRNRPNSKDDPAEGPDDGDDERSDS